MEKPNSKRSKRILYPDLVKKKQNMENRTDFIEPLLERAEAYGKTSYGLLKLRAIDKAASVTSNLISRGAVILVLSMFTVIINIGIALWLGDLLGKTYYGFFCVGGFYGLAGIVLYFFMHNWITQRISNSIITQMLS